MKIDKIIELLRCPDCYNEISVTGNHYVCLKCNRIFSCEDGIPFLLPRDFSKFNEGNYHSLMAENWEEENQMETERVRYVHFGFLKYLIELPQSSLILEVGCGTGWDGRHLLKSGKRVLESDISIGMLKVAQEKVKGEGLLNQAAYLVADGTRLPFSESSFDAVLCIAMLHHIDIPEICFLEMERVLKKGGYLIIGAEPSLWFGYLLRNYLKFKKVTALKSSKPKAPGDERAHGFSKTELLNLATLANLKVVKIEGAWYIVGFFHFGLSNIYKLLRLKNRIRLNKRFESFLIRFDRTLAKLPMICLFPWLWSLVAVKKDRRSI